MSGERHSETDALISAVRRQLWLQAAVNTIGRHLRISTAILLTAGLFHLFARPLNGGLVMALALLPLLLGVLATLIRQRPPLASAARTADRWFDGKNLITSAWELRQRPAAHAASAGLLLLRAEAAAGQWRQQVSALQPLRWPPLALPLMVALTALFLLQLPSKGWLTAPAALEAGHSAAPLAVAVNGSEPRIEAGPTPSPQPAPAAESERAATNSASSPQAATTVSDSSQPPAEAGATQSDSDTRKSAAQPSPHAAVAAVNDGGTKAGDQEGVRAERDPHPDAAALKVSESTIERQAGTEGNSGNGNELEGSSSARGQGLASAIPAAQQSHSPYRGNYTPALKSYMARYFHALNQQAEHP